MIKYLLTVCCTITILFAQAQVNSYFLHDPIWQLNSSCSAPAPCIQNESYNYYTNGDSVINTFTYKKIYRKGQGSYTWLAPPPNPGCGGTYWYIDTVPSFFLRSAGRQMFIKLPSDTTEYLLYDFNLTIGDSLPLSYNNFDNAVTVAAIDSFYTPYGYRKRFELAGNTWSQYLIEGVGHSKGLIETMQVPLECGFNLDCYSLNDTAYYPIIGPTCNLTVGVAEINNDFSLKIYPNPFSCQTTLYSTALLKRATLSVTSVLGKTLKEIKDISGHTINFTSNNLPGGVYFLQLQQDNKILGTKKIIITN